MRSKINFMLAMTMVVAAAGIGPLFPSASSAAEKETWIELETPIKGGIGELECPSPKACYARSGSLWATKDGGLSWTEFTQPSDPPDNLTGLSLGMFSFPEEATGYAIGGSSAASFRGLLMTSDGGQSWSAPTPLGPLEGWAATATGRLADPVCGEIQDLEFVSPTVGLVLPAACAGDRIARVRRTSDGGSTWNDVLFTDQSMSSSLSLNLYELSCATSNDCYILGASEDSPFATRVFVTSEGGQSWRESGKLEDVFLSSLSCPSASVCYGSGQSLPSRTPLIVRITDSGATWDIVWTHPDNNLRLNAIACPTIDSCHAVRSDGAIIGSDDGGDSWAIELSARLTADGKPSGAVSAIACPGPDTCFAGGSRFVYEEGAATSTESRFLRYGNPELLPSANPTTTPSPNPTTPSPNPTTTPTSSGGMDRSITLASSKEKVRAKREIKLTGAIDSQEESCIGSGTTVEISRRTWGESSSFESIGSANTDGSGSFEFRFSPKSSSDYLASVFADDVCAAATSNPTSVVAKAKVKAKSGARKVARGKRFYISGKVIPNHKSTRVALQRKAGKQWTEIAFKTLSSKSRFRFPVKANWKGKRIFRVRWLGRDKSNAAGNSRPIKVISR